MNSGARIDQLYIVRLLLAASNVVEEEHRRGAAWTPELELLAELTQQGLGLMAEEFEQDAADFDEDDSSDWAA